jgi:hypothetical protein
MNYKKINKIIEKEALKKSKKSKNPMIQYLKHVNKNNLMPHMIAFKQNELNKDDFTYTLKSFYISLDFAIAFSQSLKLNN